MALADLRERFFDAYLAWHPEEATTLGSPVGASRLRDHSEAGLAAEKAWWSRMADELAACEPNGLDEVFDHAAMRRLAEHHLHAWEPMSAYVGWAIYPYNIVAVQDLHATVPAERNSLRERVASIPAFLDQHQACVERGLQHGIRPPGPVTEFLVGKQIPAAVTHLRSVELAGDDPLLSTAGAAAAVAYEAHASWLAADVIPVAVASQPIGRDEVCWRLEHTFGISSSPEDIVDRARADLVETQERIVRCAQAVERGVKDFEAACELVHRLQQARFASDAAVIPTYRDYLDRARKMVVERNLFHVPDDYAIGVATMPPGISATGYAGNWPAPLLRPDKLGHFMVLGDAARNYVAWAADLAVHEGLPGHHLQSFYWQRHFNDHPAPVRFLLVHDQVAMPRNYWGLMLNIEGYAVYAEEVMRVAGFFTPAEELFVLVAHATRAGRVVADLSLHTGAMSEPEAETLLHRSVGLSAELATMEVRRYLQTPLQASTYWLGRHAIERLVRDVEKREGAAFDLASFHDRFFGFGPVPPTDIRRAILG